MTIIYNRPKCYGSEWDAYVDDEARSRGIKLLSLIHI